MGRAAEFDADFSALFLQEFPRLARTVHHIVGDRERAEELAQDAFIELLRHWRTVVDYDRPDLWLRRAFESTDDDWGRLAPAAHFAVVARHRRAQRVRRGLAVTAVVAASAAVVVALSTGDVGDSRGVEPAEQSPKTTTPALSG